jgi:hypothetical protein
MNRNNQDILSLLDLFGSGYAHNRLAGLGICTSADVFDNAQNEYEQAKQELRSSGSNF